MAAVSSAGPILPGRVQPAPAAEPPHPGAVGVAPASGLAATPLPMPGRPSLEVPADFLARLATAVEEGVADADAFAKEHTPSERWLVKDWATMRAAFPPKSDDEDLAYLHQVARTRTPEGIEAARFWSEHGLGDEWEKLVDEYAARVGPAHARSARKLLHDALAMTYTATQVLKGTNARKRPFAVDPSLELVVPRPGNNPSFPSGHTSAAFAAGLVLAHLMPDRREEFLGMAREASWARVYSGVHFPTDVVAGAKLAATITSYLVRTSMARPVTGVQPADGRRRALPGAATLAGTPVAAGAQSPSPAAAIMGQGQPGTR